MPNRFYIVIMFCVIAGIIAEQIFAVIDMLDVFYRIVMVCILFLTGYGIIQYVKMKRGQTDENKKS